jgi:hypothetical protein
MIRVFPGDNVLACLWPNVIQDQYDGWRWVVVILPNK